jgi:transcriptional regulator of NAD metabolism
MSKLFFDHLINLDDVEIEIKKVTKTQEEREELWQIVDEIIQHRILGCILDNLPEKYHEEFLEKFHDAPYDLGILAFLVEKIGENIEEIIKQEIGGLVYELLVEIRGKETESPKSSEKK